MLQLMILAILLNVTLLLAFAAGVCAVGRKTFSAAFRHRVWTLGLAGSLCLPLLALAAACIPVSAHLTLPNPAGLWNRISHMSRLNAVANANAALPTRIPPSVASPQLSPPAPRNTAPALSIPPTDTTPASAAKRMASAPGMTGTARNATFGPIFQYGKTLSLVLRPWVILLYLVCAVFFLLRLAAGCLTLHRIRRTSQAITNTMLLRAIATAQNAWNASPKTSRIAIRLMRTSTPPYIPIAPMTWGARHPIILLPEAADTWPEERVVAALLHEMAHIARRDWILQIMAQIACAVYWFHPLVWIAARGIRNESETACDDWIVTGGMAATDYADHLLEVASYIARAASCSQAKRGNPIRLFLQKNLSKQVTEAVIPMASPVQSHLEVRLRAILQRERNHHSLTRRQTVGLTSSAASLVLLGGLLRVSDAAASQLGKTVDTPDTQIWLESADPQPVITLPNGVIIKLLGIADPQVKKQPNQGQSNTNWWTANGVFLNDSDAASVGPLNVSSSSRSRLGPFTLTGQVISPLPDLTNGTIGRRFALQATCNPATQPQAQWAGSPDLLHFLSVDNFFPNTAKDRYYDKPAITMSFVPDRRLSTFSDWIWAGTSSGPDQPLTEMNSPYYVFLASDRVATLRFLAAAGPWTRSVDQTAGGKTSFKTTNGDEVHVTVDPNRKGVDTDGDVPVVTNLLPQLDSDRHSARSTTANVPVSMKKAALDMEVLALDEKNRVLYSLSVGKFSVDSDDNGMVTDRRSPSTREQYIPKKLLKRVRTLRFVERPFYTAEFRNVALYPQSAAVPAVSVSNVENAGIYVARGKFLEEQKNQPNDAIREYRKAVALDPGSVEAHIALAKVLEQSKQYSDAVIEYHKVVALDPSNAEAQSLLADAIYRKSIEPVGNTTDAQPPSLTALDEAIRHEKIAVALQPNNAEYHSSLGFFLAGRDRDAEAVAQYHIALHLYPTVAPFELSNSQSDAYFVAQDVHDANVNLADCLLKLKRYHEAIPHYRTALAFEPEADYLYLHLGDALEGDGQHGQARSAWQKAADLSAPGYYYGNEARRRLRQR